MRALLFAIVISLVTSLTSAQTPLAHLHPYPKTAWSRPSTFALRSTTPLVVADALSPATRSHVAWFVRQLAPLAGSIQVVDHSQYTSGPAVFVSRAGASPAIDALLFATMPPGETMPQAGGYVLDVSPSRIIMVGADDEGVSNGLSTLRQLVAQGGDVAGAHIWDYPDYPVRWAFNQQNLRGANAIGRLRALLDSMSALKLNAIQQNDFKYAILDEQPTWYFDSLRAFRELAEERLIGITPGVASIGYSEGILWHDPNLAEGLPATARYVIEGDTGRIIPDPRVAIPNGGFESVDANGKFTGWSFYDEGGVTVDRSIVHGGSASARCSNFVAGNSSGNCRFARTVQCRPNSAYVMTAWLRTEALARGELRLLAIGSNGSGNTRALTHTAFALPATTNGWRKVQVAFNTLEFSQMTLYVGLWSGSTGTFWVDDFEIRDHGLTNVLRREGTPLHVRSTDGRTEYSEGVDFAAVSDPKMMSGVYPWHEPPTFRALNGRLRNGDTVDIRYFHPVSTYADENGIGQTMVCVSDEKVYDLVDDQVERIDSLYRPTEYFMHHDEIRVMHRDSACLERSMTPAELLADNVTRCAAIIDSVSPGNTTYVWSDMLDSLHNAVNNYYLVDGDLRGVWNMVPKDLVIVNWNNGARRKSLDFFERLGFAQVGSPYYDQRDTRNIREWRLELEQAERARGMMYTTWVGDYSYLRPFAYYAWGAGPYIMHAPLDSTVFAGADSFRIVAAVKADPYDASDRIDTVVARIDYGRAVEEVTMIERSPGTFEGYGHNTRSTSFSYRVRARNRQGLVRETPPYFVEHRSVSGIDTDAAARSLALRVVPNPLRDGGAITFNAPRAGTWSLRIVDALGRAVHAAEGDAAARQHVSLEIEAGLLKAGAYRCEVRVATLRSTIALIVR